MLIPYLIEITADLIDAFFGAYFVAALHNRTANRLPWLLSALVYSAISIGATFISAFSLFATILEMITLFVQSFLYRRSSLFRKIIAPVLFFLVTILTSTASAYIGAVAAGTDFETVMSYGNVVRFFVILAQKILMTVLLVLIIRLFTADPYYRKRDLAAYLISPILTVALLYLFNVLDLRFSLSAYYVPILIITIGLVAVNVLSFTTFFRAAKSARLEHEMELRSVMEQSEKDRYRELQRMNDDLRAMRHDMKEHLAYLKKSIENGAYSDTTVYIQSLQEQALSTPGLPQTNNRVVDYVIASKKEEYPNVAFFVSGAADRMPDLFEWEYAGLLGNMIQNAVEAVLELPDDAKRVELSFGINGDYQTITCKNPVAGSVLKSNRELKTTKHNSSGHGYGVKSMKHTIERHSGILEFYEDDNVFCVHCAIPFPRDTQTQ